MSRREQGMRRRELIKLAGIASASALLPRAAQAETGDAKEQAAACNGVPQLVHRMTTLDANGKAARSAFDRKPATTIAACQPSSSDWLDFIGMQPSQIYGIGAKGLSGQDLKQWDAQWDAFVEKWEECEDGYDLPDDYKECENAKECDKAAAAKFFYAGPQPKIDTLALDKKKIFGEGFLDGAVVDILKRGATHGVGKPVKRIESGVKVKGTFRCSVLEFDEAISLPKGDYDVYVVNRFPEGNGYSKRIFFPVKPKPYTVS